MEFEVTIKLKIDKENNLFSAYDDQIEVLEETLHNCLHELDELKVKQLEVYKL